MSTRSHRLIFVMLCAMLLGTAGIAATRAQESATVDVTAFIGVIPVLTITVCDDSANFGTGLAPDGATPTGADASVVASTEGTDDEGVFYTWEPSCQTDPNASGLELTSNVFPFGWTVCATENDAVDASPDVTIAGMDLRYFVTPTGGSFPTNSYEVWRDSARVVELCGGSPFAVDSDDSRFRLGLRVDDNDAIGGFHTVLTFTVQPT